MKNSNPELKDFLENVTMTLGCLNGTDTESTAKREAAEAEHAAVEAAHSARVAASVRARFALKGKL